MQSFKNQFRVILKRTILGNFRKIPNYSFCVGKNVNVVENKNTWSYELNEEIKGVSLDKQGNYAMFYTCKVCETKQSRSFTKNSYHNGVVIIRCEGCQNLHLVADNLGWFEEGGVNIEDLALRNNEPILKIKADGKLQEEFLSKIKKSRKQEDSQPENN